MSGLELESSFKPGTTAISDVVELLVDLKTAIPFGGFVYDLLIRSECGAYGSSCQSILNIVMSVFSERK